MTRTEYNEILVEIKKEAFRVYAINREENRFIQNTFFDKFSKFVWVVCIFTIIWMFLQEVVDEPLSMGITFTLVAISMVLLIIMSVWNIQQAPNSSIFINYEEFLKKSITAYFADVNEKLTKKNGVHLEVSNNDINWIEIYIPEKLRMPYSKHHVYRHMDILKNREEHENCDNSSQKPAAKLIQIVDNVELACQHNWLRDEARHSEIFKPKAGSTKIIDERELDDSYRRKNR